MRAAYASCLVALNLTIAALIALRSHPSLQAAAGLFGAALMILIALALHRRDRNAAGAQSHSRCWRLVFALPSIALAASVLCVANTRLSSCDFGLDGIERMSGILCQDSSIASSGATIFEVRILGIENAFASASASRTVNVCVPEALERGVYLDRVEFDGVRESDDGGMYFARSVRIAPRNAFRNLRAKALSRSERRIMTVTNAFREDHDIAARALCMRLLFQRGFSDMDDGLNALIRKSGLSFVFALSGMHLNAVASFFRRILKRTAGPFTSSAIVVATASAYFAFASRSASFVRAYMMFFLSLLLSGEPLFTLPLSFVIQNALFPLTSSYVSFDLSYMAMCGIVLLRGVLDMAIRMTAGRQAARILAMGMGAMVFSAPVGLRNFGEFVPSALISGIPAAALAAFFLALGALLLAFPRSFILSFAARWSYGLMKRMLSVAAGLSMDLGAAGWVLLVFSIALAVLLALHSALKHSEPRGKKRL